MKKLILIFSALAFMASNLFAQKVNEKVQVDYNGSWYDATILKVNAAEGLYYITYDEWGDSWDEWVEIDRLKGFSKETPSNTGKFQVGDRVEVEYGMIPEPATIIEVGENKYHIKYDNTLFKSKWVQESEIKRL